MSSQESSIESRSRQSRRETTNSAETRNQRTTQSYSESYINSFLSNENKSFFEKMSDKGIKIAGRVYKGLYDIPIINRVVGKLEIAYNQFWIDRHQ